MLWSGSVRDNEWDPTDVFVEIKTQGNLPVNVSGWVLDLSGTLEKAWRLPDTDLTLDPGEYWIYAAKNDRCFRDPDGVIEGLVLPLGDPFRLTLYDADERLIEPIGDRDMPPFAGGYDLGRSRSMERLELMFGGSGMEPASWHFYNEADVDVPNDDRIDDACRAGTRASPGRPSSPDYSGAQANGSFE